MTIPKKRFLMHRPVVVLIGIEDIADPTRLSGIGDPEGDGQDVRRFSTRQGCLVEKS
ncbi:MAG: hypothetical protein ACOY82_17320 [Pseudomonadota bacterium]